MLRVAGQYPLVRDAADRSLGPAHVAAKGGSGAHLFQFAARLAGRARNHPFPASGKIVMVVVVMVVVRFGRAAAIGSGPFLRNHLSLGFWFRIEIRVRRQSEAVCNTGLWPPGDFPSAGLADG